MGRRCLAAAVLILVTSRCGVVGHRALLHALDGDEVWPVSSLADVYSRQPEQPSCSNMTRNGNDLWETAQSTSRLCTGSSDTARVAWLRSGVDYLAVPASRIAGMEAIRPSNAAAYGSLWGCGFDQQGAWRAIVNSCLARGKDQMHIHFDNNTFDESFLQKFGKPPQCESGSFNSWLELAEADNGKKLASKLCTGGTVRSTTALRVKYFWTLNPREIFVQVSRLGESAALAATPRAGAELPDGAGLLGQATIMATKTARRDCGVVYLVVVVFRDGGAKCFVEKANVWRTTKVS